MRICLFFLCVCFFIVFHPLLLAQDQLPEESQADRLERENLEIRDSLRRVDPIWYDKKRDSWRRLDLPEEDNGNSDHDFRLPGMSFVSDIISLLFYALIILAIIMLALFIYNNLDALQEMEEEVQSADEKEAVLVAPRFLDIDLDDVDRGDLLQALRSALENGEWDKAVICAYVALLVLCEQAELLQLRQGATNRMLQREVRASTQEMDTKWATVPEALVAATDLFEQVYFGHYSANQSNAEFMHDKVDLLRRLLREGAAS